MHDVTPSAAKAAASIPSVVTGAIESVPFQLPAIQSRTGPSWPPSAFGTSPPGQCQTGSPGPISSGVMSSRVQSPSRNEPGSLSTNSHGPLGSVHDAPGGAGGVGGGGGPPDGPGPGGGGGGRGGGGAGAPTPLARAPAPPIHL